LRPPYISPPKKPNLNPLYLPAYEDDNECIICQEEMKDNNAVKLQCGHRFHKAVSGGSITKSYKVQKDELKIK